jgi:GGDEF domain-containing protein
MLDPRELRRLKVLEGVGLESIEGQLGRGEVRHLARGDVLLTMGQPPRNEMYMILSGRLSVHLEGGPEAEPVAHLEAGETVGELGMIDASPASAHVVASEPARVLVVDQAVFWALIYVSHDFTINLLLLLARRLRSNNSTVSDNIRLQQEHKHNSLVDAMTGLHNRRWHEEALPRYGGEEFTVILPDTDEVGARVASERVRKAVAAAKAMAGDKALPGVTVSIGGATLAPGDTAASLVERADATLYKAKQAGRDRVTF